LKDLRWVTMSSLWGRQLYCILQQKLLIYDQWYDELVQYSNLLWWCTQQAIY
jgi:hypothetical protein